MYSMFEIAGIFGKISNVWFSCKKKGKKKKNRSDTTGWARWSTGRCVRTLNLTIPKNGIWTTQHLSWRMTYTWDLWDFDIQTDHLILARRPDLIIINKKKKICKIVDFAVPADHRIKLKECEKKDKYQDLARELKKLWNMRVTIITIVIGAFGTVTKGLLKGLKDLEIGGRVETIQNTGLLRTAKILRRVVETWGDLMSLKLQWKTIS